MIKNGVEIMQNGERPIQNGVEVIKKSVDVVLNGVECNVKRYRGEEKRCSYYSTLSS